MCNCTYTRKLEIFCINFWAQFKSDQELHASGNFQGRVSVSSEEFYMLPYQVVEVQGRIHETTFNGKKIQNSMIFQKYFNKEKVKT